MLLILTTLQLLLRLLRLPLLSLQPLLSNLLQYSKTKKSKLKTGESFGFAGSYFYIDIFKKRKCYRLKSERTATKRKEYHRQNGTGCKQKTYKAVGKSEPVGLDTMLLLACHDIKPDAGDIKQ